MTDTQHESSFMYFLYLKLWAPFVVPLGKTRGFCSNYSLAGAEAHADPAMLQLRRSSALEGVYVAFKIQQEQVETPGLCVKKAESTKF